MSNSKLLVEYKDEPHSTGCVRATPCDIRQGSPLPNSHTSAVRISIPDRTDALVRGILLVLKHHDAPEDVCMQLRSQLHTYLDNDSELLWFKKAKHLLAAPMAVYLGNEPPKSPGSVFCPHGDLRRWIRPRLHAFNRRNTHLWYSWLQAKRSCLPVSDEIVADQLAEHQRILTTPPLGGMSQAADEMISDPLFLKVLRSVGERFVRNSIQNIRDLEDKTPSNNACFELTRQHGGQAGFLQSQQLLWRGESIESSQFLAFPDLLRMGHANLYVKGLFRFGVWQQIIVRNEYWTSDTHLCLGSNRPATLEQQVLREAVGDLSSAYRPTKAIIMVVLEPLKVRIISKGEARRYYPAKVLQESLHGALRGLPCFRLIGRPLCPTDLIDLYNRRKLGDEWFSIDYSAATDKLSWELSNRICRSLTLGFVAAGRSDLHRCFMNAIEPHELYYYEKQLGSLQTKTGTPFVKLESHEMRSTGYLGRAPISYGGLQQNGQLMGSIVSFPILCLANLATYIRFKRLIGDVPDLDNVLINGDDMLFPEHPKNWGRFREVAAESGLELSIGKAYCHPVYANANSTCFHFDLRKEYQTPWQINFLNSGLFFGQSKVQKKQGEAGSHHETTGIGAILDEFLQGSLPGRQGGLLKLFLVEQKEPIEVGTRIILNGQGRHRNLFLPVSVGGLGCLPPVAWKFRISGTDRIIAASYLRRHGRDGLQTCYGMPLPGYAVREIMDPRPSWIGPDDDYTNNKNGITGNFLPPVHLDEIATPILYCRERLRGKFWSRGICPWSPIRAVLLRT